MPHPRINYLGRNDTDLTVTFACWSARWEYFLPNPAALDKVEHIVRKGSAAKALPVAKRLATREQRLA